MAYATWTFCSSLYGTRAFGNNDVTWGTVNCNSSQGSSFTVGFKHVYDVVVTPQSMTSTYTNVTWGSAGTITIGSATSGDVFAVFAVGR
jgi:hypothetical protein